MSSLRLKQATLFILKCFIIVYFILRGMANAGIAPEVVQRMAQQFMQNNDAPGVAIAIYDNGSESLFHFGVANKESGVLIDKKTYFEIGSITKVFNALILAQAIVDNKIDIEQPINNFLPSQLQGKNDPVDKLTFKQLATHTASLPKIPPNYRPHNYTLNDMLLYLQTWKPNWPPGTRYEYSNLGFGLLGMALEGVYKQPFKQLLSDKVLVPLVMDNTYDHQPDSMVNYATGYGIHGNAVLPFPYAPWRFAAGGIRSTNEDMMKFLKANLLAGELSEDLKNAIEMSQNSYFRKENGGVGLAWEISYRDGMTVLSKNGKTNGFTSFIIFIPEQNIGVVVMTNKNGVTIQRFAKALLDRLIRYSE